MGRFDALLNLDETQAPPPAAASPAPKTRPVSVSKEVKAPAEKPDFMKTRNQESKVVPQAPRDKPEKYSTLLSSTLVKQIKLAALERDIKDYQVVEIALTEFFAKQK